jgi:phosphoglycerate dehydrogenase-like enzyme
LTKVAISDRTVAIIGTGNIGTRLAANFAGGGQDFLLAEPRFSRSASAAA